MEPHLAVDADSGKMKFPILGLPKIDGVRGCHFTHMLTGRSLKPFANMHITGTFSDMIYQGIDGEFACGDSTSESLCRDTTSALNKIHGEPKITWHAFDFLKSITDGCDYLTRHGMLTAYVAHHKPPGVVVVPFKWLKTLEEVESFYQECLDQGYEGIILRDPNGLHKNGRCTVKEGAYLRLKPSSDKDAVVISLVEAQENQNEAKTNALGRTERSTHQENMVGKGMVGMLVCKDLTSGQIIDVGAGKMTHEERKFYWENPSRITQQFIKYRSMDVGVKDKPRFARFICIRAKEDIS